MKKIITLVLLSFMIFLTGCHNNLINSSGISTSQMRTIAELATLEVFTKNVAKYEKKPTGFSSLFQKGRELWVEYTGTAKVGIDMSRLKIDVKNDKIEIFLPTAKILSTNIITPEKNAYYSTEDGFIFKNKITENEISEAMSISEEKMKESIQNNHSILLSAQDRAKKLIEAYINEVKDLSKSSYDVEWIIEDINDSSKEQ